MKYDGERESKIFTVMIIDKDNPQNSMSANTDEPFEMFLELLKSNKINISMEREKLYFYTFTELKNELDKIMSTEYVLVYTLEVDKHLEYYISILSENVNTNFRSTDSKEVFDFVTSIAPA